MIKKIFIAILLLMLPSLCFGADHVVNRNVTYVGCSGLAITAEWDVRPETEEVSYYKVKVAHFERKVELARGRVDHPGNQISVGFPWGGHYALLVTSCKADDTCAVDAEGVEAWCSSEDADCATVDGVAQGWWVYKYVCPPTGGGFE